MLFKLVLLLAATVALGSRLKVTPDELKVNLMTIDKEVRDLQIKAAQDVRATLAPLHKATYDAIKQFNRDLKSAAKGYWDEIRSLEDEAKKKGKDISLCVKIGTEELYKLNKTIVAERRADIDKVDKEGKQTIDENLDRIEDTLENLQLISEKVSECSDDTCATILDGELVEFYNLAVKVFDSATETVNEFVLVSLPEALDNLKFDAVDYLKSYAPILQDVNKCIRV